MDQANPVLVEVTRGDFVESRHRGSAVVVNTAGEVVQAWGDVERLVYPRSALKPIQALPLIETGAAARWGLGLEEIALACASHNSEPFHVGTVVRWLDRVGLGIDDLECGPCEALSLDVTKQMSRAHIDFTRAHNNCSGKHAGFLSTALHMGEPTKDYIQPDHPVQRRVTAAIENLSGASLAHVPCSADGCGIPVFAVPLVALARGQAAMLAHKPGTVRGDACRTILDAMAAHPEMVAGTDRFDTRMMRALGGSVLTKIGAEGVHVAILPDQGFGIALKMDDGAMRASELAMACVLDGLGVIDDAAKTVIGDLIERPINTTLGDRVGEIRRGDGLVF